MIYKGACPACGKACNVARDDSNQPMMLHESPPCQKFIEMEYLDFLTWFRKTAEGNKGIPS
jgi:hypothetical protein